MERIAFRNVDVIMKVRKVKTGIKLGRNDDLSDYECVVGARWAGRSIDILEFYTQPFLGFVGNGPRKRTYTAVL